MRNKNRKWIVARVHKERGMYRQPDISMVYKVDGDKKEFAEFLKDSLNKNREPLTHCVVLDELEYHSIKDDGDGLEYAKERIINRFFKQ